MPDTPIQSDEIRELFAGWCDLPRIALAVSGGSDSVALMHLAARWRNDVGASAPSISVIAVDHDLRPCSDDEAEWVAAQAAELGFDATVLRWLGPKPKTGIQAAARSARYELITEHCVAREIAVVATAHQWDDQAETLIMRLGRGSGIDGLAAMAPRSQRNGIALLRPLLGVSKARLVATLRTLGCSWVEDPSNQDPRFERVRLRGNMDELRQLGLDPEKLALTATRLSRARTALENATDLFLANAVSIDNSGMAKLDRTALLDASEEIAVRALTRILWAAGGQSAPPRMAKVEQLYSILPTQTSGTHTLAGCRLDNAGAKLRFSRETGRNGLPKLELEPGASAYWDMRFRVSTPADMPAPVLARALQTEGFGRVRARMKMPIDLPSDIAASLVSFWRDGDVVAVPYLGYQHDTAGYVVASAYQAEFANGTLLGREFGGLDNA